MKHIILFCLLTIFPVTHSICQTVSADADSSSLRTKPVTNIRGTLNNGRNPEDKFRSFLNYLFFIPRKTLDGLLYSSIYGARMILGSKEIERANEYFLKSDRKFVWFPMIILDSDLRINAGLNLLYRKKRFGISYKGDYTANTKWESQLNLTYLITQGYGLWKIKLRGMVEEDDDRKFYGIGPDPMQDDRNAFLSNPPNEFGAYSRRRSKAEVILGFRPTKYWELFINTFYQERRITNSGNSEPLLGDVFDLANLPGAGHDVKQWYKEFAIRYDSREYPGRISKGLAVESFVGLSSGQQEDRSKLIRAGFDFAGFIPIIGQTRYIVPRVLFEMVENRNDAVPIPFLEFPHIIKFRGVGNSKIFRTDKFTLLPSLEYQWPLSGNLNAHLFCESLVVGEEIDGLSLGHRVWAGGFGIDFHNIEEEIIRVELITGSDGFRATLNFGLDNYIRRSVE